MQDYNYIKEGIFEITLEVACCKFPEADTLPGFWAANKDALVNFLVEVHRGMDWNYLTIIWFPFIYCIMCIS